MRSRISIDMDVDNQPIIKIDYATSEDVRDKMVKRFLEGFGSDSSRASFLFTGASYDNSEAIIRPMTKYQADWDTELGFINGVIAAVGNFTGLAEGGAGIWYDGTNFGLEIYYSINDRVTSDPIDRKWFSEQHNMIKAEKIREALHKIIRKD